jgi:hypothetical protein
MGSFEYLTWTALGWLLFAGVYLIPGFLILRKMGYSGWWVATLLIPYVILVVPWIFALSTWPIERELARSRTRVLADATLQRRHQERDEAQREAAPELKRT